MRELLGLNKGLQSLNGELVNILAKLGLVNEEIERVKGRIGETDDNNGDTTQLNAKLGDLRVERKARLALITENRRRVEGQINAITDLIHRLMMNNTAWSERVKMVFTEQGVTLVSILTAFSMTVSTIIILALTGGTGPKEGSGGGGPRATEGGGGGPGPGKGIIKDVLGQLGGFLGKLGKDALKLLPGLIGTIINSLLKTAGPAVGGLAEHTIILIIFVGGVLVRLALNYLKP